MTKKNPHSANFVNPGFTAARDRGVGLARYTSSSEVLISIQDESWHQIERGGQVLNFPAGRLGVMWTMVPMRTVQLSAAFRSCYLFLPMPWFLSWQLASVLTAPVLSGHIVLDPEVGNAPRDLAAFERWVDDVQSGDAERRHIVLMEVEARMRRLALAMQRAAPAAFLLNADGESANAKQPNPRRESSQPKKARHGEAGGFDKATQMAMYITQQLAEQLTLQAIADIVGLRPSYASNLFGGTFGIPPMQYLSRHRVWYAQHLLATTDLKMVQVARQAGFGSDAQFYADFRRHCNTSPRKYRELNQVVSRNDRTAL